MNRDSPSDSLKIALITDVHFGTNAHFAGKLRKLSHQAPALTRAFVQAMNDEERPHLVVNLGDVIEDEGHDLDLERYREFLGTLSGLSAPVIHVAGNHDLVNLEKEELVSLWKRSGDLYYSQDLHWLHLVVLHTEETDEGIHISAEQLNWLDDDLASTSKDTLIFMHHPASEMELVGNRWFENAPDACRLSNRTELRAVVAEHPRVRAIFNGHAHWSHLDFINRIPYITIQSLIENVEDDAPGRAAQLLAIFTIQPGRSSLVGHGETPVRYQWSFADEV